MLENASLKMSQAFHFPNLKTATIKNSEINILDRCPKLKTLRWESSWHQELAGITLQTELDELIFV
jgi:hypothetical protein